MVYRGMVYRGISADPRFQQGFGLSYTSFKYEALALNVSAAGACETVGATVTVTNTGAVSSDEVVQLYRVIIVTSRSLA
jgi:beta-glucosidase